MSAHATQQKWRTDDDTLDHDGWIEDYEGVASAMTTPPNPISEDYVWEFLKKKMKIPKKRKHSRTTPLIPIHPT